MKTALEGWRAEKVSVAAVGMLEAGQVAVEVKVSVIDGHPS